MKRLRKAFQIILPLFLGVFLCWFAYQKFTSDQLVEIGRYFAKADYFYVGLSVVLAILSHLSRAYRWWFMLETLGYKTRYFNNVMAVFGAYLLNTAIPRSGEVSRAVVINKYEDVPFEKAFGTIVSERVIDSLVLLVIVAIAFFMQFDVLKTFLLGIIPFEKLLIAGSVVLVFFLLFLTVVFKTNMPISGKIRYFLKGVKEGIFTVIHMKKKWAYLFHTLFIWVMYLLMFYVAIFALDETAHISVGTALTAFIVGGFTIAFTNGGFGSYPFFIAEVLLLFGVTLTVGTAFGWIVWISQFFMTLVLGGASFILLPVLNRAK